MSIDELIRDLLLKESRYYEAEKARKRAANESRYYEAEKARKRAANLTDAALKDHQEAYDRLRNALPAGKAIIHAGNAVHKDGEGNLYIIPLAGGDA